LQVLRWFRTSRFTPPTIGPCSFSSNGMSSWTSKPPHPAAGALPPDTDRIWPFWREQNGAHHHAVAFFVGRATGRLMRRSRATGNLRVTYLAVRAHVLGQEIAKLGKNWKDGASLVQLRDVPCPENTQRA